LKKNIIKDRSFNLDLEIIQLNKTITRRENEYVLSKQLLRSGTSVGAMIREAEHAESRPDFIHKLSIAQKEANETDYWIELLYRSKYIDYDEYEKIRKLLLELRRILSSIIITSKNK